MLIKKHRGGKNEPPHHDLQPADRKEGSMLTDMCLATMEQELPAVKDTRWLTYSVKLIENSKLLLYIEFLIDV